MGFSEGWSEVPLFANLNYPDSERTRKQLPSRENNFEQLSSIEASEEVLRCGVPLRPETKFYECRQLVSVSKSKEKVNPFLPSFT